MTDNTNTKRSNLAIWEEVKTTETTYTKRVDQGSYHYTTIAPTYQARKATEQFGPYGSGWGLSDTKYDYRLIEQNLIILNAKFFYTDGGEHCEFPISNMMKFAGTYKNGNSYIDEEAIKKLETNTISKALSRLGFNADVFMGQFDNHEYMNERRIEEGLESIESPQGDAKTKGIKDMEEEIKAALMSWDMIKNQDVIRRNYSELMKKTRDKCKLIGIEFDKYGERIQDTQRKRIALLQEEENKFKQTKANQEGQ